MDYWVGSPEREIKTDFLLLLFYTSSAQMIFTPNSLNSQLLLVIFLQKIEIAVRNKYTNIKQPIYTAIGIQRYIIEKTREKYRIIWMSPVEIFYLTGKFSNLLTTQVHIQDSITKHQDKNSSKALNASLSHQLRLLHFSMALGAAIKQMCVDIILSRKQNLGRYRNLGAYYI